MQQKISVSERCACFLVGCHRTVLHYELKVQVENERLQERIAESGTEHLGSGLIN